LFFESGDKRILLDGLSLVKGGRAVPVHGIVFIVKIDKIYK